MGVRATHYVMAAIKFPFKDRPGDDSVKPYEDNGYQEKVTSLNGLTSVSDGMNGKYWMIGSVLAKGLEDGIPITKCEVSTAVANAIEAEIKERFGLTGDVLIYAFTHWH